MTTGRQITLENTVQFIEAQLAAQYEFEKHDSYQADTFKSERFQSSLNSIVHQAITESIKEKPCVDSLYLQLKHKNLNDFMVKTYLFEIIACQKTPYHFFTIFFSLIQDIHRQLQDDVDKKEYLLETASLLHEYASPWAEQYQNWHTAILLSLTKKTSFTLDEEINLAKESLKNDILTEKKLEKSKEKYYLKYILYGAGLVVTGLGLFALSKKLSARDIKPVHNLKLPKSAF